MDTEAYEMSARGYLRRAQQQLLCNTSASLFYAAFEIRCGIEARLQEYLEAHNHIAASLKKGWRIAKLGRNLERAFKLGDKVARVSVIMDDAVVLVMQYTPVRSDLRKMGEQLGRYLHAQRSPHSAEAPWWGEFRTLLAAALGELSFSTSGLLLGPPIVDNAGRARLLMEMLAGEPSTDLVRSLLQEGVKATLRVEYLEGSIIAGSGK